MGDLDKTMKTCLPVLCFESVNTFLMRQTFPSAKYFRQRGIPWRNTLAAYEMTPKMSWGGFWAKKLRKVEYPGMRFQKPTVPTLWV